MIIPDIFSLHVFNNIYRSTVYSFESIWLPQRNSLNFLMSSSLVHSLKIYAEYVKKRYNEPKKFCSIRPRYKKISHSRGYTTPLDKVYNTVGVTAPLVF